MCDVRCFEQTNCIFVTDMNPFHFSLRTMTKLLLLQATALTVSTIALGHRFTIAIGLPSVPLGSFKTEHSFDFYNWSL